MNEITNHGNLTAEPALHHSPSGVAVLTFSVAVNGRRFNRQTNRWVDKAPVFPQVGAFNGMAENANATLVKAPRLPSPASLSTTPGPSRVVRSGAASCQPGTNTAALLSYSGHTSVALLPCTSTGAQDGDVQRQLVLGGELESGFGQQPAIVAAVRPPTARRSPQRRTSNRRGSG